MNENIPVNVGISAIPEGVGSGRLRNLLLLIDNLDENMSQDGRRRQTSFPMRTQDVFLMHVVQGEARLTVNMTEVSVGPHQILSIMPNCVFQQVSRTDDLRFFSFSLGADMHDQLAKKLGISLPLTKRYARFYINSVDAYTTEISIGMYRSIQQELSLPDYPTKQMVVERYCEIMFLKCAPRVKTDMEVKQSENPPSRKMQIYHDFLTLLEQHFREHRDISFYAESMCLTPKYLSTVVKEVSGKHGSRWIDDYVMMEAKVLLRQGDLNIKQISDALHFPTQSMFGRFFKKNAGYSPKEYKQL